MVTRFVVNYCILPIAANASARQNVVITTFCNVTTFWVATKRLRRRQYDPGIIEKTIGLVLGPSTAMFRLFLKHCTLTNKAVGTTLRALSEHPQRRQGPELCPL